MVEASSSFDPADSALAVTIGVLIIFLGIEAVRYGRHRRALAKIPIRVHVNGSRGKSSVTRLIGAAMRQSGLVTITKTTGTAPRFIMPDGREIAVFRAGEPNIIEQLRVIGRAEKLGAQALIVECMAVTPEYIAVLEDRIVRSTVGVITNIREDHLDVMGPTLYDVAVNIAKSLPRNGIAYTAEKKWFRILEEEARKKGTELVQVSEDSVSDRDMEGFSYVEHKENVAIALAVAGRFGVARAAALKGMHLAQPDPGVLRETMVATGNGTLHFFNALAANDPDSSLLIWNMACRRRQGKRIAVLILRSDRIQRTEAFSRILEFALRADSYIVAGSSVGFVADNLKKKGVESHRIVSLEDPDPADLHDALLRQGSGMAVAMGNFVGLGARRGKRMRRPPDSGPRGPRAQGKRGATVPRL